MSVRYCAYCSKPINTAKDDFVQTAAGVQHPLPDGCATALRQPSKRQRANTPQVRPRRSPLD